jgi:VanZ family protein
VSTLSQTAPSWRGPAAQRAWLLVLAWLVIIFLLSSGSFSEPSTGSMLRPFLRWLFPEWSAAEIRSLHHAIRKAAHMCVYAVLALLAFRAVRLSLAATARRLAGLALAVVLATASVDETMQSFSKNRTGALADVGYDLAGALVVLGFLLTRGRGSAAVRKPPG